MRIPTWLVLASSLLAVFLACGPGRQSGESDQSTSAPRPLYSLDGAHPRLLLYGARLEKVRDGLHSTHGWLWERYEQDLGPMVELARSQAEPDDVRQLGDMATELAFAWVMTGEDSLFTVARDHLLRLTDPSAWEAPGSLVYLIGSHFLMGISLAYDWLYPALTPAERRQVAACLRREAQAQYESIVTGRIWWRNQYLQNHSQSNFCGLAYAAAALWGEDERAGQWLAECEGFFEKLFEVLPADGSSVEGYAYAGYGAEYALNYAALVNDLLGKDYTGSPWMRHLAEYLLHGLLPYRTGGTWAMTFGDGPQRGWSSTAQHLMYLAAVYGDGLAQWMARETVSLREKGLGGQGWMMLTYFDPSIPDADPSGFPNEAFFPEVGQVMLRSNWTDSTATLVGIKCGPFMGLTHSRSAGFDWGSGHAEPDAGSFQIFSQGRFLAIGALYTGYKLSVNHNTMLFKGQGQLGEKMPGFASIEALKFGHHPEIVHTAFGSGADYVAGDVARAYHPALGVKKYLRHWLFLKPDILLVADEINLAGQGMVYDFPASMLETDSGLIHNRYGQVTGTGGEAYAVFDGVPGTYKIYACYLDNAPEQADYAILVDGREIHAWKSHNQDIDDNLITVTPEVELKKGSRITLRGTGMAKDWRLTKMAAFSETVDFLPSAEWVMHFEPQSEVEQKAGSVTVTSGGAGLDYYLLEPKGAGLQVREHTTIAADVEPFNYKTTRMLSVRPEFAGDSLTMVSLIHLRGSAEPALREVTLSSQGEGLKVSWIKDGKPEGVLWSLREMSYQLVVK